MESVSSTLNIANEQRYPTKYAASPLLPLLLLSLASQKHSPNFKTTFKDEYDYIVGKLQFKHFLKCRCSTVT